MIRLTAIVSGNVQRVGYRARVIDIANAFALKGMIENQKDGLVKIIAEGEEEKLRWFESAIDIKNTLISCLRHSQDILSCNRRLRKLRKAGDQRRDGQQA